MGAGHGHGHGRESGDVRVATLPRLLLLGFLAVAAAVTVVGLVHLWPDHGRVDRLATRTQYAAPGTSFPAATVRSVLPACTPAQQDARGLGPSGRPVCGTAAVRVDAGPERGRTVTVQLAGPAAVSGLGAGDRVLVMRIAPRGAAPTYSFYGVDRTLPIGALVALFVVVVVAVARLRGLLALIGVVVSGAVLVEFMLPALLVGRPGVPVALAGAAAILFVVLYLAHGPSLRTSTALAGTLLGVGVTAGLAAVWTDLGRMSGVSSDAAAVLATYTPDVAFRGLLLCAVIVAGLGILNDVTITQASAVWELRAAAPEMSRRDLYRSAMRIGRDHIASTIYTVVFVYAGAALTTLLVVYLYQLPTQQLIATEDIADEIVSTLCSVIGLVLAVPLTTAVGVLVVGGHRGSRRGDRRAGRRARRERGALDW